MSPAEQTRTAWKMFERFTDAELNGLLNLAGVVPCKDRGLKLHQALMVWFHGFIPSVNEITNLVSESSEEKIDL